MKKKFKDWLEERKYLNTTARYLKQSWQNMMDSTRKKMSRGARFIAKIISWPRGDNWRRPKN